MRVQHCIAPILSIAFLFASGRDAPAQTGRGQASPIGTEATVATDPFAQHAVYDSGVHGASTGTNVTSAGLVQAGYAPAPYGPSLYGQAGYGQSAYQPAAYGQTGYRQSAYPPAAYGQTGYEQSAYLPAAYGQPGYEQSVYTPAAYGQPGHAPAGWGYPPVGSPAVTADPQAVFTGSMPPYTNISATPLGLSPPAATMGPWPDISPYEHDFNQHYVQEGLWHEITKDGRTFNFSLEYLSSRTRKPKGIVGDANALRYLDMVSPTLESALAGITDLFDNQDPSAINTQNIFDGAFNYYNRLDLEELADIFSDGIRARWGFDNPDGSGFELEAWWQKDGVEVHDARSEDSTRFVLVPIRGQSFLDRFETSFLQTTLDPLIDQLVGAPFQTMFLNLRGLPLNDGSPEGVTVPYDIGFAVENRSESIGGALDYFFTPVIRKKLFRARPLVGFRYMFLDEEFKFTGVDSGFLYDEQVNFQNPLLRDVKLQSLPDGFDNNADGVVDEPGATAELGAQSPGGAGGGIFIPVAPLTIAWVDMKTQSNLFGPEIGCRYELGGDKVKLWGQSKFALLANHEEYKLRGDNIGMITRRNGDSVRFDNPSVIITENEQALIDPTPENPHPNLFGENDDHNTVSPLLEQGFYIDARVLSIVPVINRMKFFEEARFTMGWTIIYIANVAETNNSIVWDGNPMRGLFPHLEVEHSHWITSNWSFGVSWEY